MQQIAGRPYWVVQFDQHGALTSGTQDALAAEIAAAGVSNLFLMSHGWNNDVAAAEALYGRMFPIIKAQCDLNPDVDDVGFIGLVWPSILFPDDPGRAAVPTGIGAQSIEAAVPSPVNVTTRKTGGEITAAMAQSFPGDQQEVLVEMGRLIDDGLRHTTAGDTTEVEQAADVQRFHTLLQQLVGPPDGATEDSGEMSLLASPDPVADYQRIATAMATGAQAGDAQGIGSIFGTVWNGAKDALRVASFWQMKNRAGVVGKAGLGPLLEALHSQNSQIRVHLIGHSFGARLVACSLSGISSAAASPVASLLLLQGAFSHWAFASNYPPNGDNGSLLGTSDRVHGPLVSTFTQFDWAVGRWYPKASFLSGEDAQSEAPAGRWGGMGADGFQSSQPAVGFTVVSGQPAYPLVNGTFHQADANGIITDTGQSAFAGAHSDIVKDEIGWLAARVALPI